MAEPSARPTNRPVPLLDSSNGWEDPLDLDSQLTEQERRLRDRARLYAQEKLLPRVIEAYREERTDRAIFNEMGEGGLLGPTIPERYGGASASYIAHGLVARELDRVDSGYGMMMNVQSSLVIHPIYAYGSESQREKFLPRLATGEWVGCFGLGEPDADSAPGDMKTEAEKIAGGYCLSGTKTWISNSPIADLFVIWARSRAHHNEVRGFVLSRDMKGLTVSKATGNLSLRTCITGHVMMDRVVVPEENLLPNASGVEGPFGCLDQARYVISWGALGAAEDCWHRARRCALDRQQYGRPLAASQLVQEKLADMQTEIALGLQISLRAGRLMDGGRAAAEMISLVKRNNCAKALDIARMAHDIQSNAGINIDNRVMRHMQNLEALNSYEGTPDVHALILGRAQTGDPPFA